MGLTIPISERARHYGYVIWSKKMDYEVRSFLGKMNKAEVWFESSLLGEKNIDWKYRRISIGYARTRKLPLDVKEFVLNFDKKGALKIICR